MPLSVHVRDVFVGDAGNRIGNRVVPVQIARRIHVFAEVDLEGRLLFSKTSRARPPRGERSLKSTPSVRSKCSGVARNVWPLMSAGPIGSAPESSSSRCRIAPLPAASSVRGSLILHVQCSGSHTVLLLEHPKALGQLGGPAAVELIREVEIVRGSRCPPRGSCLCTRISCCAAGDIDADVRHRFGLSQSSAQLAER